jgi:hypothetical protein
MNDDDLTTAQGFALVGILLLLIIPVATALALWLKQRYAQAVVRLQTETVRAAVDSIEETAPDARLLRASGSVAQRAAAVAPPSVAAPTLRARHAVDVQRSAADPTHVGRRLRARVLGVQLLFGTLYWVTMLIMVAAIFAYLNEADKAAAAAAPAAAAVEESAWVTAMGHLAVWPLLLAPPLLAWAIQAGARTRWLWWGFGVSLACVGVGSLATGSLNVVEAATSVAVLPVLGIMLLAFMRPSVRGAGPPLVVAITVAWLMLCTLFGAALLIEKLIEGDAANSDEAATAAEWVVGIALLALMLGASAWAGWRTLPRLARHYAQKRYSEVQLALGAYWALITAHGVGLVLMATFDDKQPNAEAFTLAVVLLFLWWLWRWTQRLALRWTVFGFKRAAPPPLPAMLLLRVFKPSARSEDFMDRFLARWRFIAPVWMIAGPDLAGAYMEPDEFFAFVDRSLATRFVTRDEQVPARLAELDNTRDPDGRFRVNDLYCANTTWKTTVLAMIERAGVIVLDLREYTTQRAGTRFELRELLGRAPLSKVVLLVDEQDDMAALQSEIDALWQELASTGHARSQPGDLAVVTLGPDSDRQLRGLVDAVAQAAAGH